MNPAGFQLLAELTDCRSNALSDVEALCALLKQAIAVAGFTAVRLDSHSYNPLGSTIFAILTESHVALHTYPEAEHVSVDIFTCSADWAASERLLASLKDGLQPSHVRTLAVERGRVLEVVREGRVQFCSTDGLEISLQVESILYAAHSDYQLIQVVQTPQFGRVLVLDGHVQLAELDQEIYAEALLAPVSERLREGASVLVLGGGDGAIATEIVRRGAGAVEVVDIDPTVRAVCEQYFPALCAQLEAVKGTPRRGEVSGGAANTGVLCFVHREALEYLTAVSLARGELLASRGVDVIVCDLTMHPESFVQMPRAAYLDQLFAHVVERLAPGGMLVLQCASSLDTRTLELLRTILPKYFSELTFTTQFIPSLCRSWVFAACERPWCELHATTPGLRDHGGPDARTTSLT